MGRIFFNALSNFPSFTRWIRPAWKRSNFPASLLRLSAVFSIRVIERLPKNSLRTTNASREFQRGFSALTLHNSTTTTHYWAGRTRRKKWPRWFRKRARPRFLRSFVWMGKWTKPRAGNKTEALQLCEQTNSTDLEVEIRPAEIVRFVNLLGVCFSGFF